MRWGVTIGLVLSAALALGCGTFGGSSGPDHCKVRVVGVEQWDVRTGKVDVSYRVAGEAGSAGIVWLAAKVGEKRYLSGGGVDVGPGPFQAIVDLKLTGVPREFKIVLEVAGHRCDTKAKMPSS